MPQKTLWSHHYQRLAPRANRLASQAMEILCGRSRTNDLKIIIRREVEKAPQSRTRMLRTLALKTMRQKEDQAAQPLPLVFRARDKLIHNRLCRVPEISILRLPQHEAVGIFQAVAILESQNSHL